MEKLFIQGESDRPEIQLDHEAGRLFIGGNSLPENVNEIYQPVLDWIEEYIQQPNADTTIEFFFEYFNTATSNILMRIIEKCTVLQDLCDGFTFNWCYSTGDYDMREFGEELIDIFNIPVNIVVREVKE